MNRKKILEILDSSKKNSIDFDQHDFWASTWVQSEMAYSHIFPDLNAAKNRWENIMNILYMFLINIQVKNYFLRIQKDFNYPNRVGKDWHNRPFHFLI